MITAIVAGMIGAFIGCCLFFLVFFRELRRPDALEQSDREKLDEIIRLFRWGNP